MAARDFWRAPAELRPAPDFLLGHMRANATRPKRLGEKAPPCAPRRKAVSVASRDAFDTCAEHPSRVGHCRYRSAGDVVVLPPRPEQLCRGFEDDAHELLVVEIGVCPGTARLPWLDDPEVQSVYLGCNGRLLDRDVLRAHVLSRLEDRRCRQLSRAIYKRCSLGGQHGPVFSLVPMADAVALLPATAADSARSGDYECARNHGT